MQLDNLNHANPKTMDFKQIIEVYNANFDLLKEFVLTLGDKYIVENFANGTDQIIQFENRYTPDRNNLFVYINGVLQLIGKDYIETGVNSIQLLSERDYYDEIKVIIIKANALQVSIETYIEDMHKLAEAAKLSIDTATSIHNEMQKTQTEMRATLWAQMVVSNRKTIDEVPDELRPAVIIILDEIGFSELV